MLEPKEVSWSPGVAIHHPWHQSSQNCSRLNSWFLKTNFTWPCNVQDYFKKKALHITCEAIKVGSYLFDMPRSGLSSFAAFFCLPCLFLHYFKSKWVFPKIVVPQNGWLIMENPIKMDDLGAPLFLETPKYLQAQWCSLTASYVWFTGRPTPPPPQTSSPPTSETLR